MYLVFGGIISLFQEGEEEVVLMALCFLHICTVWFPSEDKISVRSRRLFSTNLFPCSTFKSPLRLLSQHFRCTMRSFKGVFHSPSIPLLQLVSFPWNELLWSFCTWDVICFLSASLSVYLSFCLYHGLFRTFSQLAWIDQTLIYLPNRGLEALFWSKVSGHIVSSLCVSTASRNCSEWVFLQPAQFASRLLAQERRLCLKRHFDEIRMWEVL